MFRKIYNSFFFLNISLSFLSSGNDAFSKKEHAEETRWARRHVREY